MRKVLLIAATVIASCVASEASAVDLNLARAAKSSYMADTGDAKGTALRLREPLCGYSRHDKSQRWTMLSRTYRTLNNAVDSADPDRIVSASQRLHRVVNASTMYQACHREMVRQASAVEAMFGKGLDYIMKLATGGG